MVYFVCVWNSFFSSFSFSGLSNVFLIKKRGISMMTDVYVSFGTFAD